MNSRRGRGGSERDPFLRVITTDTCESACWRSGSQQGKETHQMCLRSGSGDSVNYCPRNRMRWFPQAGARHTTPCMTDVPANFYSARELVSVDRYGIRTFQVRVVPSGKQRFGALDTLAAVRSSMSRRWRIVAHPGQVDHTPDYPSRRVPRRCNWGAAWGGVSATRAGDTRPHRYRGQRGWTGWRRRVAAERQRDRHQDRGAGQMHACHGGQRCSGSARCAVCGAGRVLVIVEAEASSKSPRTLARPWPLVRHINGNLDKVARNHAKGNWRTGEAHHLSRTTKQQVTGLNCRFRRLMRLSLTRKRSLIQPQ